MCCSSRIFILACDALDAIATRWVDNFCSLLPSKLFAKDSSIKYRSSFLASFFLYLASLWKRHHFQRNDLLNGNIGTSLGFEGGPMHHSLKLKISNTILHMLGLISVMYTYGSQYITWYALMHCYLKARHKQHFELALLNPLFLFGRSLGTILPIWHYSMYSMQKT